MFYKEIVQSFDQSLYYEKKIVLNNFYSKYYIKNIVKKPMGGFNISLDNNLLSNKNSHRLPPFYAKKQKQQLIAISINYKCFDFKSNFRLDKRLSIPYFSLNKSLQPNVQNLKEKYLQILNTLKNKNIYNYAKITSVNKGGYIVKTFSGIRGFVRRRAFTNLLTKDYFFFKFISNKLLFKNLKKKYSISGWFPINISNRFNTLDLPQLRVSKKRKYNRKKFRSSYIFMVKKGL